MFCLATLWIGRRVAYPTLVNGSSVGQMGGLLGSLGSGAEGLGGHYSTRVRQSSLIGRRGRPARGSGIEPATMLAVGCKVGRPGIMIRDEAAPSAAY